ncbi:MAG TPA: ABC transporter ATP-binding protein [Candidatus Marinimicrobia bacterium]|jgi:subfamily B ATP-binding cassette protein MsbA|nr:ABC transporter ATP-binding protein [Candidatus Neomarinimicrobiota bacterium]MDP7122335.1 ABC transporter ATP-binding protein [Candidatus Neomarinimicrobiota bacterium]MDP7483745.1 ABC transporter ATP-binding protein [Candidatus Neomarinimicrobiota bacterium]MDP7528169.1 ABC transporter ATP-binding protein [Candidatus Neomarinimicrobiota bacterium]HJL84142.1 ABC transporter ATP-binding protein [Candidatus Neomarinimicrobiota bacterium]
MFKRVLILAKPHWLLLFVSILSSVVFVFFNSLSIWLTASFISNILTDFETLLNNQAELLSASERTVNETLKMWTNRLILDTTALGTLKKLCLSIFFIFFLKNIFLYLKNFFAGLMQIKVITDLRNSLFDHLASLSLSFFDRTRSGDLTSIVLNDVATMRRTFSVSFQKLLVEPINILTFFTLLFLINWKLTLAAMLILPAAVTMMVWVGGSIRRKAKRSSKQIAGIVSILQEVLGAIRVVKAFVMEKTEKLKFRGETAKYYRLQKRQMSVRLASSPVTEMIGVTMGVILLWLGGQDVLIKSSMEPEDFIRFILLLFSILNPIKSLNTVNADMQTALASAERVYSILDTESTINDAPEAEEVTVFERAISFEDVHFTYDDGEGDVVQGISFEIKRGQIVAVVGESGAGKSTIADLIPRFFDVTQGSVKLDGKDVRSIQKLSLRDLMGIVAQETILFNDTIAKNIVYGQEGISEEKLRAVAEAANALSFIEAQPDGFETVIGDRGVKLSGGQRQRLAIARALLKNPPILIMDEATSSLDSESEKKVQEAIEKLMKDRTVFVIAHRLSTVVNAEKIIVLSRGKIVETGTHEELIEKEGHYKQLYEVQFGEISGLTVD